MMQRETVSETETAALDVVITMSVLIETREMVHIVLIAE
jgi:hypothetical protein